MKLFVFRKITAIAYDPLNYNLENMQTWRCFNKIFVFFLTHWERGILLVIITQNSSPRFLFTKVFNFMCRIKMNFKYIFGNVFCPFFAVITQDPAGSRGYVNFTHLHYVLVAGCPCVCGCWSLGWLFVWHLSTSVLMCLCVCFQCMRACPRTCLHFRLVRLVDSVESEYKNH